MIEFKALAMKADTNKLHVIFLLKKNIWSDIIKMILGYPSITASEILKKWKIVIILVGQEYESMEGQHDYKTETGTTHGRQGQPMNIGKLNNNFKDRKPKCFNCNKYGHIAKECWKKKEKDMRKYFKYKKWGISWKIVKKNSWWRNGVFKKNQITKIIKINRRVLEKVSSKHGTRDLCKISE